MLAELNAILLPAYFWAFSLVAIACAIGVLIARHPLHGAISLIGVMLSLAGLYALLDSPYLAVLQVLVYAGAIMMLVVFVLMVLNQARDDRTPRFDGLGLAGLVLPVGVAAVVVHALRGAAPALAPAATAKEGGVATLAPPLFDVAASGPGYYLLFLLIGVLLLVAIVAAVLLAKRSLETPGASAPEPSHEH